MDSVEKAGFMLRSTWNACVADNPEYSDVRSPEQIGVNGDFDLGGMEVLFMACDEHMTSTDEARPYDLAERLTDVQARLAYVQSVRNNPQRRLSEKQEAHQQVRATELRTEIEDIKTDPMYPVSARFFALRQWFIASAVWIEF